jgi:hypothetical protein
MIWQTITILNNTFMNATNKRRKLAEQGNIV